MLFVIYGKMLKVWVLSTISTLVLVPIMIVVTLFPVVAILAAFMDLELDFSSVLPPWWIFAAIPLSIISFLMCIALSKVTDLSLRITKEIGLLLLWAPPLLLFLWFIGVFNPTAFNNLCDTITDKLEELNYADMLDQVL